MLIPARLTSTRLPDKPLADIGGVPMIVQVWRRAVEAALGPVIVACAEEAIVEAVKAAGGEALATPPHLPSGTDRIFHALEHLDPERQYEIVVNVQGDFPTLDPVALRSVVEPIEELGCDVGTLAFEITDAQERTNPNVVKAVLSCDASRPTLARALYFTRAGAPWGDGPLYHHVGIYAFRRENLERFCAMPPSPLERRERLEQLRALEGGMSIGVRLIDTQPFGVDTPEHLARARAILAAPT